jgi:hypothetical protein
MTDFDGLLEEKKSECVGKFFRAQRSYFMTGNGGFSLQIRMTPLKRKSCPGCKDCEWIMDEIQEGISCETPPLIESVENGKIYKIGFANISTDFETGYVDGYDIILIEEKNR